MNANTNNLMRRYWAGGYHFGQENNQFDQFIHNEYWKIGWGKEEEKGKPFYQKINEVKIGDFFALKSLGGQYDLTISALGIVVNTKSKEEGELGIKWLKSNFLYKEKAPKGTGAGNWFGTLLEIKRQEDIATIFQPIFESEIEELRAFTAQSDAFNFWHDEREDIYQDYLKIN